MKTFEQCCEYLGISEELPKCQIRERQHQAAYKLSVCMEAWNKIDHFEPDETTLYGKRKEGYAPHFLFKDGKLLSSGFALAGSSTGIVSANATYAASSPYAYFGLRLSFETKKRAVEFGQVFIETFNELI